MSTRMLLIALLAALPMLPSPGHAQIRCAGGGVPLPVASRAIDSWQTARGIHLTPRVRANLDAELCDALRGIASQGGPALRDADAGSRSQVFAYLDDASSKARYPSLTARLESAFLLGASPRAPEQGRMALLTIRLTRSVDRIFVGDAIWTPISRPRLLSEYGAFSFRGVRGAQVVCKGQVTINGAEGAMVVC
jgi:hypothetical protein